MDPCILCHTYNGHNAKPSVISLLSTPHGSVCSPCIRRLVKQELERLELERLQLFSRYKTT